MNMLHGPLGKLTLRPGIDSVIPHRLKYKKFLAEQ
jgi:hypothetical protein